MFFSVISPVQIVAALSNGNVKILDCEAGTNSPRIVTNQTYNAVHRRGASTAVFVLNNEIFSGSDNGEIVRIVPNSGSKVISILSHVNFIIVIPG